MVQNNRFWGNTTDGIYTSVSISVRAKAIGFGQFRPALPIMAEVADGRVKTAAGARAVGAIWQEW